jgi:hypothetical protein
MLYNVVLLVVGRSHTNIQSPDDNTLFGVFGLLKPKVLVPRAPMPKSLVERDYHSDPSLGIHWIYKIFG